MYKVLIADDEQIERDALRYVITRGCDGVEDLLEAANGREAIEVAERDHPEIVLMDVKMPGTNGVEAARQILDRYPDTRVVFLTAFDYFDYAQEAVRLGASDFIVKPSRDDHVVEIINGLVSELNADRELRDEHVATEKKLQRVKELLERELVTGVLGSELSSEQVTDYLEIMGLEPERFVAVSAQIDFSSYPTGVESVAHRKVLTGRCAGALTRTFHERGFSVLRSEEDGIINLLLLSGPDSSVSVLDMVREAAATVQREFSLSLHMGADAVPRGIEEIGSAFRHACVARSRAVDQGRSALDSNQLRKSDKWVLERGSSGEPGQREGASSSQTPAPSNGHQARAAERRSSSDGYPYELERRLCDSISADDQETAIQASADFIDRLSPSTEGCRMVRRRLLELLTIVTRQFDLDPESLMWDGVCVLDRVESACSTSELKATTREAVMSLMRERTDVSRSPSHIHVERVRRYIEAHYDEPLSLEDAAAKARLSAHYFSRLFKSYTGMTFVDFVNSVRVSEAKRLLRSSTLSIKEISTDVGFEDQNYFTRVFKQHSHVTPTGYRNNSIV